MLFEEVCQYLLKPATELPKPELKNYNEPVTELPQKHRVSTHFIFNLSWLLLTFQEEKYIIFTDQTSENHIDFTDFQLPKAKLWKLIIWVC